MISLITSKVFCFTQVYSVGTWRTDLDMAQHEIEANIYKLSCQPLLRQRGALSIRHECLLIH